MPNSGSKRVSNHRLIGFAQGMPRTNQHGLPVRPYAASICGISVANSRARSRQGQGESTKPWGVINL